jgi:hypothetical protein
MLQVPAIRPGSGAQRTDGARRVDLCLPLAPERRDPSLQLGEEAREKEKFLLAQGYQSPSAHDPPFGSEKVKDEMAH